MFGQQSNRNAATAIATTFFLAALQSPINAAVNPATEPANWTPILMKSVTPPRPFVGIDGLTNLVYEVVLTNFGRQPVKLIEIQALDKNGQVLLSLSKQKLADNLTEVGKTESADTLLQPGETGIAWMNISFPAGTSLPSDIRHKVTYKTFNEREEKSDVGALTSIDTKKPIRIGPPLKGSGWIANNCYDGIPHRRALFPVSNDLYSSQRYAIDWTKLNTQGQALTGNPLKVNSYPAYDEPIIAVADGTILGVVNEFPDQVPGTASKNKFYPGGNTIIMSLPEEGAFAFYAHIKPGTIAVKEGDKVTRGQVIGHVGNVGNSSEPHLHFHVTDKPTIFAANSIPYAIDNFTVEGKIDEHKFDQEKLSRKKVTLEKPSYVGPHQGQMPKEGSVITFGQ
ncbi:MAG: M23 family metallopeptidase [Candidatus Obscuribacterales bacterium]|nr:M23 family metallopeptidase [Candidatus Obscuribacterales bacterium]